jgi:hypothetical protein
MYGPGTGISVIAVPTGIAPFVAGNGGGGGVGAWNGVPETEGLGDCGLGGGGVAGESVTGESPDMSIGACRAHAVSTEPATAPVVTAKNPRRFIARLLRYAHDIGADLSQDRDPWRFREAARR